MSFPTYAQVEKVRNEFPKGSRVRLVRMDNEPRNIPVGTEGTVHHVDDTGSIHVHWDNGPTLAVLYGIDECEKIS